MATQNEGMDWLLRTKLDGAGLEAAQRGLKQTGDAAKGAKGELESLGYSAEALKRTLLEALAAAEIWSQLKEGVKDAMELAGAMRRLEMQANATGDNFEEVKKKTVELAEHWNKIGGYLDDRMIPMIQKAYLWWGNIDEAVKAVNLAMAIHAKTGKDEEESLNLVRQAALGQTRSLKELGIGFDTLGGKAINGAEALEKVREKIQGATIDGSSFSVKLRRITSDLDDMRKAAGEKAIIALDTLLSSGKTTFRVLGEGAEKILLTTGMWATKLGIIGTGLMEMASGTGSWAQLLKNLNAAEAEYQKKYADITEKSERKRQESFKETGKTAIDIGKDQIPKALATGAEKDKVTAEERKKFLEQIEKDLAASQVKAAASSYDKRIAMAKVYELEMKKMLAELERLGIASEANKARVVQIALNQIQGLQNDAAKELLRNQNVVKEELKKINEEILKDEKEKAEKGTALAALEAKEKIKLMKQEHQQQIELANAGIGLLTAVFGESKELAIAQAIINTYEGATKALSQGGIYGAALAAVVIATGLAQVATIASTNPGGTASATPSQTGPASGFGNAGFDNPSNDRAAFQAGYLGGRGWAADQIALTTRGLAAGYADGMRSGSFGTTYNQQRSTVNHNYGGVYITNPNDRSTALQLLRQTDRMRRSTEDARTTARAARTSV